jgi:hypothetical protein
MSDNLLSQDTVTGFYNMTPLAPSAPWPLSQTFTAPSDMTLESVKLWIGEIGDVLVDRLLYIYIRDVDEFGKPGALDLTYSFVNTSTMTLPGWVEFVLDEPIELTSGTSYSINAYADGGWWEETDMDYLQYFSLGYATGNPYAGGATYYDDLFMGGFQEVSGVDLAFQLWGAADSLVLEAVAPLHEATGIHLAPAGLEWSCEGFDAETMVFDVYFRMFGVTQFTLVGNGQSELTLALPDNLVYNFLYFWKVNVRDIATDEILLEGDEWNFNTEALIEYPRPSTRTVLEPGEPPGGTTMTVPTAENCVAAIRYLVAASQNTIWYEYVAGT